MDINKTLSYSFVVPLTDACVYDNQNYCLDTNTDPVLQLFRDVLSKTFSTKDSGNRWRNDDIKECSNLKDIYKLDTVEQEDIVIDVEIEIDHSDEGEHVCKVIHNIKPIIKMEKKFELKHGDAIMTNNSWDIDYVINKISKDVYQSVEDLCRTRKQSINNVLHKVWGENITLSRYSNAYIYDLAKLFVRQCPSLVSYEAVSDLMAIFGRIGREIHGDEHQRKALAELFTFIKRQTSPIYGINLIAINIDEMEVIENGQKENEPAV